MLSASTPVAGQLIDIVSIQPGDRLDHNEMTYFRSLEMPHRPVPEPTNVNPDPTTRPFVGGGERGAK
jgi:hypothetical protein